MLMVVFSIILERNVLHQVRRLGLKESPFCSPSKKTWATVGPSKQKKKNGQHCILKFQSEKKGRLTIQDKATIKNEQR